MIVKPSMFLALKEAEYAIEHHQPIEYPAAKKVMELFDQVREISEARRVLLDQVMNVIVFSLGEEDGMPEPTLEQLQAKLGALVGEAMELAQLEFPEGL